ncbi:MAG: rod shape-determining protein MreC [Pseudomonadales bacterium]|nr:rod shape-determining protein MreC [Pseudomonadales bacterium]
MKALFVRESGAGYLLTGLGLLSVLLLAIESSTGLMQPVREQVEGVASPIYLIAESPYLLAGQAGSIFSTQSQLRERNLTLQRQILELTHISQQFVALKAENDRLRQLLGSQGRLPYEVLIAEVVGVVPNTGSFQVIVDKGADAGIQTGQAVLDASGLFGQVITVAPFSSRVLLLTDRNHAVPVQVNRNGVRSIAGGSGLMDRLELENVPVSADIVEGDLLETSGLGGRFPTGYPVGVVTSVLVEPTSAYAQVVVQPSAQLDRSRHVLVIFEPQVVAP